MTSPPPELPDELAQASTTWSYIRRIPEQWWSRGRIVGLSDESGASEVIDPGMRRSLNQSSGAVSGIVVRRPPSRDERRHLETPLRPPGPRSLVSEFHLQRQMIGRVRDVVGGEFSAVFAAGQLQESSEHSGEELLARFRIDDVLNDRQKRLLVVGLVFDLVTGRRVSVDLESGEVVSSTLETRLFFRRPRALSAIRRDEAFRRADAALTGQA
jgi:hypothetical protein